MPGMAAAQIEQKRTVLSFALGDSTSLQEVDVEKEIFTKTPILKAVISLFPPGHVRISYGPPPTQYAHGLSDLSRTCIGGESEVVRRRVVCVPTIY